MAYLFGVRKLFLLKVCRLNIFLYFCGAFWFEGSDVSEISRLIGKQVKVLYRPAAVSSETKLSSEKMIIATEVSRNHGKVLGDGVSQKTCRSVLFF